MVTAKRKDPTQVPQGSVYQVKAYRLARARRVVRCHDGLKDSIPIRSRLTAGLLRARIAETNSAIIA